MNDKKPFQFSIAWMLILMAVLALLFAVLANFGFAGTRGIVFLLVLILLLLIAYRVGTTAIGTKKELHFWQASAAYIFLVFTAKPYRYSHLSEPAVVLCSLAIGIGLMLSIVPFYRGNLATKLYTIPAFLLHLKNAQGYFKYALLHFDWNETWKYWLQREAFNDNNLSTVVSNIEALII